MNAYYQTVEKTESSKHDNLRHVTPFIDKHKMEGRSVNYKLSDTHDIHGFTVFVESHESLFYLLILDITGFTARNV